jgi:hypothetical protein
MTEKLVELATIAQMAATIYNDGGRLGMTEEAAVSHAISILHGNHE